MFSIEWLASRSATEPVERTAYDGVLQRAAFVHAQSAFAAVKQKHPEVHGFRIIDEGGEEVERWFAGDDYRQRRPQS